jgi:hypothetical protein
LTYLTSAAALSVVWWLREPPGHYLGQTASNMAVAGLRGLAMGLLCTSLGLDWRLRALKGSSARSARQSA